MDDSTTPLATLTAAIVAASVAEGKKFISEATHAGWSKLRSLIAGWAGPSWGAIDHGIAGAAKYAPADKVEERAQEIPARISEVKAPITQDLLSAASELLAELKNNPKTAATTQTVITQTMGNISGGIAVQATHGASVTITDGSKAR